MKGFHSAAVLAALMLAACADPRLTAPPLASDDALGVNGIQASSTEADENFLMSFQGGGIEGVPAGSDPGSVDALSMAVAQADGFSTIDVQGASATRAFGINAVGQIVGAYTDATGTHGYLWDNGTVTTIQFPGSIATEAWGINPQGDIVGRYRIAGDARTFGFLLQHGAFTNISVPGHLNTLPIRISASRDIVGCFHDTNFLVDMRGYVQRGDRVNSFELLSSTMHNGVASGGRLIAGIFFETDAVVHGYVLERGAYTQFDAPGATFTQAWDVSPTGTVVGYFNAVTSHGFSRDAHGLTVIDVPGARWTRVFGVNVQGEMVGSYADASNAVHGFVLRR